VLKTGRRDLGRAEASGKGGGTEREGRRGAVALGKFIGLRADGGRRGERRASAMVSQ
jgi:hypothetical protein